MDSNSRITVTGATGMVGRYLVAALYNAGYRNLNLLTRPQSNIEDFFNFTKRLCPELRRENLQINEVSLFNPHMVTSALNGTDLLIHCAAHVAIGGHSSTIGANTEMTKTLVDSAARSNVKNIIYISSVATLGEPETMGESITTSTPIKSIWDKGDYGIGKFLSENEIKKASQIYGIKTIILNPATIIGFAGRTSGSGPIPTVLAHGSPVYPTGGTGFVDVEDVANIIRDVVVYDYFRDKRFILCSANITFKELLNIASISSGRKGPKIRLSGGILNFLSRCDRGFSKLFGTRHLLTPELARILQDVKSYDGSNITSRLNFKYTPIETTIARTIKQFLDEK